MSTNVTFQENLLSRQNRAECVGRLGGFRGCTIWLTGLSGAGKTTISFALEKYLVKMGIPAYSLDGDNIRHGLNSNLGFSPIDREENIRRISEVARLFADSGMVCITSFISPFQKDRDTSKKLHQDNGLAFFECHVNANIEVCEKRDPRGMYKKARRGEIKGFTGIDQRYEEPTNPDIVLDSVNKSVKCLVMEIVTHLHKNEILPLFCVNYVKELYIHDDVKIKYNNYIHFSRLNIDMLDLQWLQILAEGWATPMTGFMKESEFLMSQHYGQLSNDGMSNQSIAIILPVTNVNKDLIESEQKEKKNGGIVLVYDEKEVAILTNFEFFEYRKEERCSRQWGTCHKDHPYIKMVMDSGEWLCGGDIHVFERITWNDGLDCYRLTPNEIREKAREMEADVVFAFQVRNPLHNGHVLLIKSTEQELIRLGFKKPVLLLHPLGGWTKQDDVPLEWRLKQHKKLLESGVLNKNSTILAIFPSPMMYGGPTEVQWHAKTRLVAGAKYYIVGRDPAGIKHPGTNEDLYEPTHGGKVLSMAPGLHDLKIIPFRVAAYNKVLERMDFFDTEKKDNYEFISGSKMRAIARAGNEPPSGFMDPEAWNILVQYYKSIKSNGH
ncbi:hypothetical protein A3Q56_03881 [Intoshia linei]|uniref:Uncharacterized protein n=1 Tax=Intoshia linei TaxID=1819745 RepID=A0A177B2E4_9BILA|nr:hypothetical protein A3Q56_03881 [Intoshia linei]